MRHNAGFTFIEVILVLAIIGILALLSGAFYGRFYDRVAMQNVANGVVGELQKAQLYAMEGRSASSWGIHNGSPQLILFKGGSYAGRDSAFDEIFTIYPPASVSGFTDVVFSRMTGTPSATPTIQIVTSVATQSVSINSMGVITR